MCTCILYCSSPSFHFQKPGKKEAKKDPSASKAPAKKKPREGADDGSTSKKKKPKKKKDPNAPKRAISGFMFFSKMEREVFFSPFFLLLFFSIDKKAVSKYIPKESRTA